MTESDLIGLDNAARFAIQPNIYGLCGDSSSQKTLRDFVTKVEILPDEVAQTLSGNGFPHLNAFLNAISQASGKHPYSEEVVLSYWFGNDLTETIVHNSKALLVEEYGRQISPEFSKHLKECIPESLFLTHLSQVALVAASDYDEPERTNLINQCMIARGKVIDFDMEKGTARVRREILSKKKDGGYEVVNAEQTVKIDKDLILTLCQDEEVAIHLGFIAGEINADIAKRLSYWTKKVAAVI